MDAYLENLIQRERDKFRVADQEFMENNEGLKGLREMQAEQMQRLIKDDWGQDLAEMKEMNKMDLKQFVKDYQQPQSPVTKTKPVILLEMSDNKISTKDKLEMTMVK